MLKLTRFFFHIHVVAVVVRVFFFVGWKNQWRKEYERRLIRVCMPNIYISEWIKYFTHDSPFTLMENETCRRLVD
jgi:hypothetical protein